MLCQFERLVFPQNARAVDPGSFMIAVYRPCEKVSDHAGNVVTQIKAVGYGLPISSNLRFDMNGHWTKNPKQGLLIPIHKTFGIHEFIF